MSRLAVVTPSYARDFALCRLLNETVLRCFPSGVRHYIIVDARDAAMFSHLVSSRTEILKKEQIVPQGFMQLPLVNRWRCRASRIPISGWLVQQIAKIAAAHALEAETLLIADSDIAFVRAVDTALFVRDGATRLFRRTTPIHEGLPQHAAWYRNACRLLGAVPVPHIMHDYIAPLVTWNAGLVRAMCTRIETVMHMPWADALARTRDVSEYLLYGVFVERVAATQANVWIDDRERCASHWEPGRLSDERARRLAAGVTEGDLAFMITSHASTPPSVRRSIVEGVTAATLRMDRSPAYTHGLHEFRAMPASASPHREDPASFPGLRPASRR